MYFIILHIKGILNNSKDTEKIHNRFTVRNSNPKKRWRMLNQIQIKVHPKNRFDKPYLTLWELAVHLIYNYMTYCKITYLNIIQERMLVIFPTNKSIAKPQHSMYPDIVFSMLSQLLKPKELLSLYKLRWSVSKIYKLLNKHLSVMSPYITSLFCVVYKRCNLKVSSCLGFCSKVFIIKAKY